MNQFEFSISYLDGKDRFHNDDISVIGTNILYLYDEFIFRFENAFFIANNNEKFLQTILQIEYPEIFDYKIGSQVFGTYDINTKEIDGVGSPIFILSEYILILSSSRMFNDDIIELNNFIMYNLGKGHGYSIGGTIDYTVNNNIQSSINISKFFKGSDSSSFNRLEEHSNFKITIQYFF